MDRLAYDDAAAASYEQAMARISRLIRQAVREDIRQSVNDTGGAVDVEVQHRFATGRK